jgi:hypothetical protein
LEKVVRNLQEVIKEAPSRDEINNLYTNKRSKLKNYNKCFNDFGKKVRAVEHYANVKESFIDNVHNKIFFVGKFLGHAGSVFKYEDEIEEKHVYEVKMLSDKIDEPLLDLDKCSWNELINILQNFVNDPSFNVHQTGFGSYITNHVIKENIQRYNNEVMIPPKLEDVWIPIILTAIGKESHHAILDLGSSVIISKELYDLLDLDKKWRSVILIFHLLMILQ